MYFQDDEGSILSAWHDIPLFGEDNTYNMVVEIPRFSNAKFEIHRDDLLNPIKQDIKNGTPRFIANIFPWHGHVCNYGAFPQTWENPYKEDPWTGQKGDRDPIDVCEVGPMPIPTGSVVEVRVLGILGLIDSGETDWKVIVMNKKAADLKNITNMDDLEKLYPKLAESVVKFYTIYKMPFGGVENKFAFNGEIKDPTFADEVILFTHGHWKELVMNTTFIGPINCRNTGVKASPCLIDQEIAEQEIKSYPEEGKPATIPKKVNEWKFVNLLEKQAKCEDSSSSEEDDSEESNELLIVNDE
eukprot:GFUD01025587.1.p1 GENE.GFUD01025587.1~~GFUD01025587.1.p1  ORF type:complete len:300 (+),score=70.77 GFUD01025587.1:235-1134(+)